MIEAKIKLYLDEEILEINSQDGQFIDIDIRGKENDMKVSSMTLDRIQARTLKAFLNQVL